MGLDDLRLGALLARLRSEASQAADKVDEAEGRSEYEHGWQKGYTKGLARALHLIADFLGR